MISVVMPVYNAELYLKKSIYSILNQSYKNFEFLILDDNSNDNSKKIIKSFSEIDNRIKVFEQKTNIGVTNALNFLIKKTKYNYIARMDADDISHTNRFSKQLNFLQNNQNCSVVGSYIKLIDNKDKLLGKVKYPISSDLIKKKLINKSCIPHPACMFNSKFLKSVNGYRQMLEPAEDYDLWTRLSIISDLHNIPEYLFSYRVNESGISNKRSFEQFIKSEFVKKNFEFLKENRDLINIKNISHVNKKALLDLFENKYYISNEIYLNEILLEKKNYKLNKFFFKILLFFLKNPKYSFKKIYNCITNIN